MAIYEGLCDLLDKREDEKKYDKETLENEFIQYLADCLGCESSKLQFELIHTSSGGGGLVSLQRKYKGTLSVTITSPTNSTDVKLKDIYFNFDTIKEHEDQITISYCGISAKLRGDTSFLFNHMFNMLKQEILEPKEPKTKAKKEVPGRSIVITTDNEELRRLLKEYE